MRLEQKLETKPYKGINVMIMMMKTSVQSTSLNDHLPVKIIQQNH